jgi:3-oxoacyl-[acyl-carrier-protein] synthase II
VRTSDAVWITGVGTANPLGNSYATVAANLLAGQSGIRTVSRFGVAQHRCKVAALIGDVPIPPEWTEQEFRQLPGFEQLLVWCITGALRDAGWWENRGDKRLGLVLGLGAEWIRNWEIDWSRGGTRIREPHLDQESILDIIRRRLGLTGLAVNVAAACASGNQAIAQGRRWVQMGWVDACIAGACSLEVTPMSLAGFGNIGALTRRNDDPAAASRPFDRGRDGFVMGDGGAMFVLESAERARRRGSRVYGEVAGFGASSDAFHMVTPGSDPELPARAVRAALAEAKVNPEDVDYINAHATSTPMGDPCESRALQLALGAAVHKVPVSSTKSMTGHLLSASAAVEALACLVTLEHQAVPPTLNLDDPDPECELCHVRHQSRTQPVRVVLSNSFGFGGCNTSLLLRKAA